MSAESALAERLEELLAAIDDDVDREMELEVYPKPLHSPRYFRAVVDARNFMKQYRDFNPKGKR